MSNKISESEIAQVVYEVYDAEETVEINAEEECMHKCRYCKNIGVCEFGMFANSL